MEYRHGFDHFIKRCPDRVFFYDDVHDVSSKGAPGERKVHPVDDNKLSTLTINGRNINNLTADELVPECINQVFVEKEIEFKQTQLNYLNTILK